MIQRVPCSREREEAESHAKVHGGGGCSSLGSLGLKEKEEGHNLIDITTLPMGYISLKGLHLPVVPQVVNQAFNT